MQMRARWVLFTLLLAAAAAAAAFVGSSEGAVRSIEGERRALDALASKVEAALARIGAAQQAYVDYGLRDEAAFARVGGQLQQLTSDAAALRPSGESAAAIEQLEEFWAALAPLNAAHAEAQRLIARGDTLQAADLLFGSARPHVATLEASARAFREAERVALDVRRGARARQTWMVVGAVAVLWTAGLLALVRIPRSAAPPSPAAVEAAAPPPSPPQLPAVTVDLDATAELCAAIARLEDATGVSAILERAAGVLDARGLVLWMGAGNDLFAAAAFGYDAAVVGRLRPIPRDAGNATARAWRTGTVHAVAAEDTGLGAIVAPLPAAHRPIGVLAAEVRGGREHDAAARALMGILSSQLATVLSAWPAASEAAPTGNGAGSDRQTAAS